MKLQELTKDVQVADQMEMLIHKKVRKRQLTGASIRDCFGTESVFAMWRQLHSNQGIIFQKQGAANSIINVICQTPEKKRELKPTDSNSKIQRS